jgi:membrane protease YdiL (CAAX protease family)
MEAADSPDPSRRREPLIVTILGLVLVAATAHFLRFYPVAIAAASALVFSWALRERRSAIWDPLAKAAASIAARRNAAGGGDERVRPHVPVADALPPLRRTRPAYLGAIEGNLDVVLALLPFIWLSAAICEEIVYRGFIQQRLERILGGGLVGNAAAIALTSLIFAANHAVQGLSGMIQTFIVSCVLGAIFIRSRHNLVLMILIHGVWDTFSVTVMYFGLKWGV